MEFLEIANALGFAKYPEGLNTAYQQVAEDCKPGCDIALIDDLQNEFGLFDEYYDVVKKTANAVNDDPFRSAWVKAAALFVKDKSVTEARQVPVPNADGTQITALLPLYILLPQIPLGIAKYRNKGFSEEELATLLRSYAAGIRIVESQTGMPGINWLYYYWLTLYTKASIFNTCGLQFELRYAPDAVICLKNRENGQIQMLATGGRFHKSGIQVLGSAGYKDDDGAFSADFAEDTENYYGHAIVDSCVDPERRNYPKSVWESILRPGDQCLSLHIPRGADISGENMTRALKSAREIVKHRYPEHAGLYLFGSSWILDPKLRDILGENSKIGQLVGMFRKYPQKSGGDGVFGYVFPKKYESIETLPEDTTLQRKLKEVYLNGGYIYDYAGFVL